MMKKMKAGKYLQHVEAKAAYEASRPKESTYALDKTDEVFDTIVDKKVEEQKRQIMERKKPMKKRKRKNNSNAGNDNAETTDV